MTRGDFPEVAIHRHQNRVVRFRHGSDQRIRRIGCDPFAQADRFVAVIFKSLRYGFGDALIDENRRRSKSGRFRFVVLQCRVDVFRRKIGVFLDDPVY